MEKCYFKDSQSYYLNLSSWSSCKGFLFPSQFEGLNIKETPEGTILTGKPTHRATKDGGFFWIYL